MEMFERTAMATTDTSNSTSRQNQSTLSILNYDEIWEILILLPTTDLMMGHMVVPQWRHVTSRLLKRLLYWDSTPREWLQNENLAEWKQLLEVCTNLQELSLHELENLEFAQVARILECIPRLCKNLKVFHFDGDHTLTPIHGYDETAVNIDLTEEQRMFPWIPFWGAENEKEIILSCKMLEPQSKLTASVLDYAKRSLSKFEPYIRDPYWFSMTFERRTMRHVTANTSIDVARLQSITLGICESKTNSIQIMEQWRELISLGSHTYFYIPMVFSVDVDFPNAIETICRVLRLSEQLKHLSRAFPSVCGFRNSELVRLQHEIERPGYKCRCCACWSSDNCRSANYCDYCSSKLALYEWNTYWLTEYKYDRNFDWSKYEDRQDY